MADFARYLPLSQRPRADERDVTSDRRAPTAAVLREIARALRAVGEPGWTAPTDDGGTVAAVVEHLVAGFDRRPVRRTLDAAQRALGMQADPHAPAVTPDAPTRAAFALESRATHITDRRQPTRLVELDDAVVAAVLVGDALGADLAVPALASGAVALRRAAAAPTPIRAVISGHSLHATDAGWTIGHGPALAGTARELIRFLAGIGDAAPGPAREGEPDED
ncbi:hypothetical protein [Agromyces sp. H66]|uniref:hypothetical protein n=1 Tax=Agromyces sp. H66 TaxID=2529859 RepID=UPI0010A9FED6|nr:hypothetical protein [Agromyces sp. H66]